jgi:hypothetical protein
MDTQYGSVVQAIYTFFTSGTYFGNVIPSINGQSLLIPPNDIDFIKKFMAVKGIYLEGSLAKPNKNITDVTEDIKKGNRALITYCNEFLINLKTQYTRLASPVKTEELISIYLALVAVISFLKAALVTYILILSHNIGKQEEVGKQQEVDFETKLQVFEKEKQFLKQQLEAKQGNANVQQRNLLQQINDLRITNENELKQKNVELQQIKNQVAEMTKDKNQVADKLSLYSNAIQMFANQCKNNDSCPLIQGITMNDSQIKEDFANINNYIQEKNKIIETQEKTIKDLQDLIKFSVPLLADVDSLSNVK